MSHLSLQIAPRIPAPPPRDLAGTRMEEALRILDQVQRAIPAEEAQARAAALRLRALLGVPATVQPIQRGGLAPWQQRRVERHMLASLDRPLRLDELAREASLSVSHFARAFRESFGAPPHLHLRRMRVAQARHLMRTTDAPLVQIALDCGFADQAHLSKNFRRLTGETPSAWRRLHATGPLN